MNRKDKLPAFVTYGWCRSAYAVVWSLGQRGIDVHVGDASQLAMSRFSRYCKSFTKLPEFFIEPEKYFDEVCKALKKTGAKVLFPAHEDIGIFSKYHKSLPPDVLVVIPDFASYTLAEDKLEILKIAEQVGCPCPHTFPVTSFSKLTQFADNLDWPIVIKTRVGNSAKGVRIAHDHEDLITKTKNLITQYKLTEDRWPFVQEFLPGDAAGVCLLYDHGKCIAAFTEKYLRCKEPGKFGTSTLRETYDNKDLINCAIKVMDKLKWHGVAHLDFIEDKNKCFKLIEINPRLWGALALAIFSGVDFPYLWYLTAISTNSDDLKNSKISNVKCRWIVGDCLAFMERLRHKRFMEAIKVFCPKTNCYHDDFNLKDPVPVLFEALDYLIKFYKAGSSLNPVIENMIR